MKKMSIPAISFLILAMAACGGAKTAATPEEAVKVFFEKMAGLDIDGAKKYATKESAGLLDLMKMGINAAKSTGKNLGAMDPDRFKNAKIEVGVAKISGDEAIVPIVWHGASKNLTAKKEGGSWKVAFEMMSMLGNVFDQIGSDKFKNAMENAGSAGDNLKDMMNNPDMKDAMDKAKDVMNDPAMKEATDKMKEQLSDPKKLKELQEALEKLKEN